MFLDWTKTNINLWINLTVTMNLVTTAYLDQISLSLHGRNQMISSLNEGIKLGYPSSDI